ncbi:uncharacterized protein LOC115270933 [Aedes albopictus]|uniref:CCHC-type domain-containing protein n=1 Tax=Aedes albopictus TaxID=7160 RepID=A0ABM1YN68_AEDAL
MEIYRIYAKDLEDEEVDYELAIHGCPTGGPLDARYRSLRLALRQPEDENVQLESSFTLENDLDIVPQKLRDIEKRLETDDLKCFSRLVHYHKRIRRYLPETDEQRRVQETLLDAIVRMVLKYYNIDIKTAAEQIPVMRIRKALPKTIAVSTNPESCQGWRDEAAGGGTSSNHHVDQDLISFVEGMKSLPGSQGTPKGSIENGPKGGVIPKRIESRRFNASHELAQRPLLSQGLERQTWSGPLTEVIGNGPAIPFPNGGEKPAAINESPKQKLLPPLKVYDQRETPAFPSMVPNDLAGQTHPKVSKMKSEGWGLLNTFPENRNVGAAPANLDEYVHVSEIERYVKAYVGEILAREKRSTAPIGPDVAEQFVNLGLRDSGVAHTVGRMPEEPSRPANVNPQHTSLPRRMHSVNVLEDEDRDWVQNLRAVSDNTRNGRPSEAQANLDRGNGGHLFSPTVDFGGASNYSYRRRLPHQTCNIIEKWPKFSGDSNPVPVIDFLRQIEILSRSYQVTSDELRMHAHLLFKDDAYVWFTAYESQLTTWDALLSYLKMRYDNPNRDKFIREEMRNRKQKPNELFSAYLTDLEAMAQRMTRKMNPQEKFDLIIENMKLSYRRRLALEPVNSIEHLAQLCYRFDALEANLYAPRAKPVGLNAILHEDDSDKDSEEAEEACLLALQAKNLKKGFSKPESSRLKSIQNEDTLLCWNCRKTGHMWRECSWKKGIFCHICGCPDTVASKCPENHHLKSRDSSQSEPKNE